jgi:hypothetical protein
MEPLARLTWKILRTLRGKIKKLRSRFPRPSLINFPRENVNALITEYIAGNQPGMLTRFGSTELTALLNYHDLNMIEAKWTAPFDFMLGKTFGYKQWDPKSVRNMQVLSGFYPSNESTLTRFSVEMFKNVIPEIDVLFSIWPDMEWHIRAHLQNKIICEYDILNFNSPDIWTAALRDKKVLVVHPFEASIRHQYAKRDSLFKTANVLPRFTLLTLKAVQSVGDSKTEFADWFQALDWMNSQIDSIDFDVALIAAGAYGMPLAAHVKKKGKVAIHVGGALQLLFGIKGARWDDRKDLYNEHWIRPLPCDVPAGSEKVENGCYW